MKAFVSVEVGSPDSTRTTEAQECAEALGCILGEALDQAPYRLVFDASGTYLQPKSTSAHGRIQVDFCAGAAAHRRQFGGGRGQIIAKAVGVSSKFKPHVLDATAGLGSDAFVLASLGCEVTMLERSPVARALLRDGLRRAQEYAYAQQDRDLTAIVARMHLVTGDSIHWLERHSDTVADVIYLDPMFPERNKKAAVKKAMQALHVVVGMDEDEAKLLAAAQGRARFRIVVKRPRLAPAIAGSPPTYQLSGKACRYDIYTYRSLP